MDDPDLDRYVERARSGPCFICELVRNNPDYVHHVVFEDDDFIAFLDKYPTLLGKTIVAPKRLVEHVVSDLTEIEFQRLMAVVYRVASAVQASIPTERMCTYCLLAANKATGTSTGILLHCRRAFRMTNSNFTH